MNIERKVLRAILPEVWLDYFEMQNVSEHDNEWRITLMEREECIPLNLKGRKVVQNGYMNPVEVSDFPLRGKPTYLKFIRRRWKEAGAKDSYFNEYDFHPEGMKATSEFGNFLKGINREAADWVYGSGEHNRYPG